VRSQKREESESLDEGSVNVQPDTSAKVVSHLWHICRQFVCQNSLNLFEIKVLALFINESGVGTLEIAKNRPKEGKTKRKEEISTMPGKSVTKNTVRGSKHHYGQAFSVVRGTCTLLFYFGGLMIFVPSFYFQEITQSIQTHSHSHRDLCSQCHHPMIK